MEKISLIFFSIIYLLPLLLHSQSLIIPEQADVLEKKAAEELALHLELALGKRLKIIPEGKFSHPEGRQIYIGNTARARKADFDFSSFGAEEWLVQALSEQELIIGGGVPRGTLYGIYEYLEHDFNAMWLDEWNIHIEKKDQLSWSAQLKLHGRPAIRYRSIYSNFIKGSELFKIRNRQNYFHTALPKVYDSYGIAQVYGSPRFCHTFYFYTRDLDKKDYDILSVKNGRPNISVNSLGPGQICYSNPKTAALITKKLLDWIAGDRIGREPWQYPVFYALKTNDNRNECECPRCRRLSSELGWSGLKLQMVNQVARTVAVRYPDIFLVTDAYGVHGIPSSKIQAEKNVIIEVAFRDSPDRPRDHYRPYSHPANHFTRKLHQQWHDCGIIGIWDYWLDCLRPRYPSIQVRTMAENIRYYAQLNAVSIMGECGAAHLNSLWRMRNWIAYRFMKNPNLDLKTEVRRFTEVYYGKAAPYMLKFYELLEQSMKKIPGNIENYTIDRRIDLDEEFFRLAESLLSSALRVTSDDALRHERVMDERVPVEWAKIEKFHVRDEAYIDSFHQNALRRMSKFLNAYHYRQAKPKLETFYQAAKAHIPALKGFEKQTVLCDYTWPKLAMARYNQLVKDEDAMGGYALMPKSSVEKQSPIIDMGIYDQKKRTHSLRYGHLPTGAWPQDEKFHWYYLGRSRLSKDSLLYMHPSWTLQLPLSEAVGTPEIFDNDSGIYVSLKVQGPCYVKGSAKTNYYAVDRVVVVRGDVSPQKTSDLQQPDELKGRSVIADLHGISLHIAKKKKDALSECGCAVEVGNAAANGKIQAVFSDNTGKLKKIQTTLTLPDDNQYHIYSIRTGILTDSCRLILRNAVLPLGNYYAITSPEQPYELLVSLRHDKRRKVWMDRCWLVTPR